MLPVNLERHLPANPITASLSNGQPQKSVAAGCFSVDINRILL